MYLAAAAQGETLLVEREASVRGEAECRRKAEEGWERSSSCWGAHRPPF